MSPPSPALSATSADYVHISDLHINSTTLAGPYHYPAPDKPRATSARKGFVPFNAALAHAERRGPTASMCDNDELYIPDLVESNPPYDEPQVTQLECSLPVNPEDARLAAQQAAADLSRSEEPQVTQLECSLPVNPEDARLAAQQAAADLGRSEEPQVNQLECGLPANPEVTELECSLPVNPADAQLAARQAEIDSLKAEIREELAAELADYKASLRAEFEKHRDSLSGQFEEHCIQLQTASSLYEMKAREMHNAQKKSLRQEVLSKVDWMEDKVAKATGKCSRLRRTQRRLSATVEMLVASRPEIAEEMKKAWDASAPRRLEGEAWSWLETWVEDRDMASGAAAEWVKTLTSTASTTPKSTEVAEPSQAAPQTSCVAPETPSDDPETSNTIPKTSGENARVTEEMPAGDVATPAEATNPAMASETQSPEQSSGGPSNTVPDSRLAAITAGFCTPAQVQKLMSSVHPIYAGPLRSGSSSTSTEAPAAPAGAGIHHDTAATAVQDNAPAVSPMQHETPAARLERLIISATSGPRLCDSCHTPFSYGQFGSACQCGLCTDNEMNAAIAAYGDRRPPDEDDAHPLTGPGSVSGFWRTVG